MPRDSLAEYRRKRDFKKTDEPDGSADAAIEGPLRFMVHKHHARGLHYDLRLELDGVMKSWAIPKGPSAKQGEKRLAAATEDHPLSYASYEGVIAKGEYGGGPSLIWDAGTFAPDEKIVPPFDDRVRSETEFRKGIAAGKVGVTLRGKKLKGSWALVRMKEGNEWLLLKHNDAASNRPAELTDDGTSVATGFDLDDLRSGAVPHTAGTDWSFSPAVVPGSKKGPLRKIEPMLSAATPIPTAGDWIFEPKLDGIRVVVTKDHDHVELRSRNGNDVTKNYPGIVAALKQQPASTAIYDAEVVAITPQGLPSFELLQQRMNLNDPTQIASAERTIPTALYVFDVMYLDGYDLCGVALRDRKEVLARVLLPMANIQETFAIPASAAEAYKFAVDAGFEGLMAKRADSRYEPGKRSGAWIKKKGTDTESFVIAGFTPGTGHRGTSFGGLVIGEWVEDRLEYRGKVGSGFTDKTVKAIRAALDELKQDESPFAGPTLDDKTATWVKPEIGILVEYANRTNANILRAPIFKGIAQPIDPVRESPAADPWPARKQGSGDSPTTAARASSRSAAPTSQPTEHGRGASHDDPAPILEQLAKAREKAILQGDGWKVPVTNLDKPLWPSFEGGPPHTKRDVLAYTARMAHIVDPYVRDRPLTLLRFPNGIHDKKFYQKHWEAELPPFVETLIMYSDGEGGDQRFLMANNMPTLLWLCQLADIEWHVQLARIVTEPDATRLPLTFTGSSEALDDSVLNYPDFILLDLDPYIYAGTEKKGDEPQPNATAFAMTCNVALSLKEILDGLGLDSFVKTSGATGLHIFVPVLRQLDYSVIRAVANTICMELLSRRPKDVTMEWETKKRTGKVFLDANQNARHKNLACAYSPRAKPGATVSMPLRWDEVSAVRATDFTLDTVPALVAERGDPWATIYNSKQDLHKLLGL